MEKHRAIPEGYMTVGEIAKRMGITVRTLHHYDKAGLFSPSAESEGGYRLYSYKDMVKLNQILAMKHLGFSLDDIKNSLVALETPDDVAVVLSKHAVEIHEKIETLTESLKAIEALKTEVLQMQSVDFKKYADIITLLQEKNENYWAIKHMDEDVIDHVRNSYTKDNSSKITQSWSRWAYEAAQLHRDGVLPESEKGQSFAKAVWAQMHEFVGGDVNLIKKLSESVNKIADSNEANNMNDEARKIAEIAYNFLRAALDAYFIKFGYEPFE